ncbi:hypothetical protein B0A55_04912 [Friedmanniomyces simplex]|uniref:Uncharacterized protein n=1 Tax=Friedmanniomyces simplex TaxID=329884 RepID=A0A4U0XIP7_9PEZI|nr:hypothetical protein B0A55_04912 [Friedmanniomyces simplex]
MAKRKNSDDDVDVLAERPAVLAQPVKKPRVRSAKCAVRECSVCMEWLSGERFPMAMHSASSQTLGAHDELAEHASKVSQTAATATSCPKRRRQYLPLPVSARRGLAWIANAPMH